MEGFRTFAKSDDSAYTGDARAAAAAAGGNGNGHGHEDGAAACGVRSGACRHDHGNGTNGTDGTNGTNGTNGHPAASGSAGAPVCPSTGLFCTNGCAGPYEAAPDALTGVAEPIFPFELRKRTPPALHLPGAVAAWHRPVELGALLALKAAHPEAKLVCGNTEVCCSGSNQRTCVIPHKQTHHCVYMPRCPAAFCYATTLHSTQRSDFCSIPLYLLPVPQVGIEMKFKSMRYPVLIAATHVKELTEIRTAPDGAGVVFGASVTLSRLGDACKEFIASRPAYKTRGLAAIAEQLRWFAGRQIRNVSSIGGNICTGSPISDINPLWVALGATFVAAAAGRPEMRRRVPARDFFVSYRKARQFQCSALCGGALQRCREIKTREL